MPEATEFIVIYIDDDLDDIEFVSKAFRDYTENISLVTFDNPSEGLSYLNSLLEQNTIPCLVILDINMPHMNGKELLVKLRDIEDYASIPVVLFSTSNQPTDLKFADKYNAGFITKPVLYKQMEFIMDELISHCSNDTKRQIRKK